MGIGYFLHVGDRTTCGGRVIEGDESCIVDGCAAAREGDAVTCGVDRKTYRISGGVSARTLNGRRAAGSLDSVSSCPCDAMILPSLHCFSYSTGPFPDQAPAPVTRFRPQEAFTDTIPDLPPTALSSSARSCVFAKSCVSVPSGSTDAGSSVEPARHFGATALLAPASTSGSLGRVAGTLGSDLGGWVLRGLAGASTAANIMVLALWPRDLGDSTLYSEAQLREMRSASTRVRFQFRRAADGSMQVYGLHTRPGSGEDRVPVVNARRMGSEMVAVLDGITIVWTPNDGPLVTVPTPYPGSTERLDNILVHPIAAGQDSLISHYPGKEAKHQTWQDTIVTFPADAGWPPLYLVFSRPGYHQPPTSLAAFPDATRAPRKSSVQGGGHRRRRWKDQAGRIYEWDYQHGMVEMYSKQGIHLGEYDPISGQQTKPARAGRRVEK